MVLLLLALCPGCGAARAAPEPEAAATAWNGLAEGAALKLGATARQLAETAGQIAREGRIGHLTQLRSDADELVRKADLLVKLTEEPEDP